VKIEIDTSNVTALKIQERELRIALEAIQQVIRAVEAAGHPELPIAMPSAMPPPDLNNPTLNVVRELIATLPSEFTSSDVYDRIETQGIQATRSNARAVLTEMLGSGQIVETERGQGRRPSKFRKA